MPDKCTTERNHLYALPTPTVDGNYIKRKVLSRLSFHLSDYIYDQIDELIAEYWNCESENSFLYLEDLVFVLQGLRSRGIVIGYPYLEEIAEAVLLALEDSGHLKRV